MAEKNTFLIEPVGPLKNIACRPSASGTAARIIPCVGLGLMFLCGCTSQPACPPNSQFQPYPTFPGFQQQPMTLPSGTTVPTVGAPTMMQPTMTAPNGMVMPMTGQPPVFGQPITGAPAAYPAAPGQPFPPGYVPGMQPR